MHQHIPFCLLLLLFQREVSARLIVHHTVSAQHLEGVEIQNSGQQGRLGRYPVHFHACGDHPNSIVKKNVV
jgi:hypothetical protein